MKPLILIVTRNEQRGAVNKFLMETRGYAARVHQPTDPVPERRPDVILADCPFEVYGVPRLELIPHRSAVELLESVRLTLRGGFAA